MMPDEPGVVVIDVVVCSSDVVDANSTVGVVAGCVVVCCVVDASAVVISTVVLEATTLRTTRFRTSDEKKP